MNSKTASHTALDRSDERVRHDEGDRKSVV